MLSCEYYPEDHAEKRRETMRVCVEMNVVDTKEDG